MASQAVVNLVVDATQAEAQANIQLRRIVNDAERNAPEIQLNVTFDQSRVSREFGILGTRIDSALGEVDQNIRSGFVNLSGDLQALTRQMQAQSERLERSFDSIAASLDDIGRAADNNMGEVEQSASSANDESSRLADTLQSMGTRAAGIARAAASIGLLASVGSTAVPIVAGLVQSLANIAPASAAGVTAFVTLKAATLTLKAGLLGVSEAIEAVFSPDADPAAVAEALERLAPNAREFVLQLQKMKPALSDLQLEVQNRLFAGFGDELARTSAVLMPDVVRTSTAMADSFNRMGKEVGSAAREVARDGTLGNALDSGTAAMRELEGVPADVVRSVARIAEAGGPLLERFADRVSDVVGNLSDRIEASSKSGGLQDAVDNAGKALAQLGRIAQNVFGILGNVFGVAQTSGEGLFGTLEKITQTLEDATATEGFRDALTALIGVGSTLANNVLPLVAEAFAILGPVVEALAPSVEEILNLLGTELLAILPQLAPVFQTLAETVGTLLEAFGPILVVIFDLVNAALPLLNPLLETLQGIIERVAPHFQDAAQNIGEALVPAVEKLVPIIESLLPALEFLISAFIVGTAVILGQVIPAVIRYTSVLITLIGWVTNLAVGVFQNILVPAARVVAAIFSGDLSRAGEIARQMFVNLGLIAIRALQSIVDGAISMAVRFAAAVARGGSDAIARLSSALRAAPGVVASQLGAAAAAAIRILAGLAATAFSSGAALISNFASGIRSQIGAVASAVASAASAARDYLPFSPAKKGPLSGRGYTLYSGQKMMVDFAKGILIARSAVQRAVARTLRETSLGVSTPTSPFVSSGQSVAGIFQSTFARTSPAVNVYLGNELIRDFVRVEIDDSNLTRDRQASQGVRF